MYVWTNRRSVYISATTGKLLMTLKRLPDLGYILLGSTTALSGGEAQRVKLALELSKRDTGRTLYIR